MKKRGRYDTGHYKEIKMKKNFRIKMNWHGERHVFYRHARSPEGALPLACRALANKLGVSFGSVQQHFNGTRDNYQINEVKKEE